MSYINPAGVAGPRQRPSTVTAAGYLIYAAAALYLVNAIVSLATLSKTLRVAKDVMAQSTTNTANIDTVVKVAAYAGVGIDVVIAAVFVLMAAFVLRGSNAWRITTWVIAGLAVLCSFCGLVGSGVSSINSNNLTSSQKSEIQDAVPTWAHAIQIMVMVLLLLALILAIILLTLRSANEFFRKQPAYGAMPYADPAYPGYPAQPGYPAPGQQAQPGYPQYPGYPAQPQHPQQPQQPQQPGSSTDGPWTPPSA